MESMEPRFSFCLVAALVASILLGSENANAQESIRPSLAGSLSAESRRPVIDTGQYNIQLGPALLSMSALLDLEYNDNIALSETNRKSVLIVEPLLNTNVLWQNGISIQMGMRRKFGQNISKVTEQSNVLRFECKTWHDVSRS
jgi:hypothetical protein